MVSDGCGASEPERCLDRTSLDRLLDRLERRARRGSGEGVRERGRLRSRDLLRDLWRFLSRLRLRRWLRRYSREPLRLLLRLCRSGLRRRCRESSGLLDRMRLSRDLLRLLGRLGGGDGSFSFSLGKSAGRCLLTTMGVLGSRSFR